MTIKQLRAEANDLGLTNAEAGAYVEEAIEAAERDADRREYEATQAEEAMA